MSKSSKLIEIINFLTKYKIKNATINDDFTVDVDGCVEIHDKNLKEIPIQFGVVEHEFDCDGCHNLISLKGCPKSAGAFICSGCWAIKTLEYSPQQIWSYYECRYCLTLTSLQGAPEKVNGLFWCEHCDSLTSLQGAPKEVGGHFDCSRCKSLKTLDGCPEYVGGTFNCKECPELKSLDGLNVVKGKIYSDFDTDKDKWENRIFY